MFMYLNVPASVPSLLLCIYICLYVQLPGIDWTRPVCLFAWPLVHVAVNVNEHVLHQTVWGHLQACLAAASYVTREAWSAWSRVQKQASDGPPTSAGVGSRRHRHRRRSRSFTCTMLSTYLSSLLRTLSVHVPCLLPLSVCRSLVVPL